MPRVWPALLLLASCAPSFESMVENRHYRQMVCSTNWAEDTDAEHEARVITVLEEALDPRAYVDALREDDLRRLLGERGAALHARVIIVRLVLDVHDSALEIQPSLSLEADGTSLPLVADTRWDLSQLTGETLPEKRTVEPSELERDLHAFLSGAQTTAELSGRVLRMLTLGIVPFDEFVPDAPRAPTATTYHPTDREYACQAPVAETIYQSLVTEDMSCELGRCVQWRIFERPPEGTPLTLSIDLEYRAQPPGHNMCDGLWTSHRVALPPGPTDEALATVFQGRVRSLRELRTPPIAP